MMLLRARWANLEPVQFLQFLHRGRIKELFRILLLALFVDTPFQQQLFLGWETGAFWAVVHIVVLDAKVEQG